MELFDGALNRTPKTGFRGLGEVTIHYNFKKEKKLEILKSLIAGPNYFTGNADVKRMRKYFIDLQTKLEKDIKSLEFERNFHCLLYPAGKVRFTGVKVQLIPQGTDKASKNMLSHLAPNGYLDFNYVLAQLNDSPVFKVLVPKEVDQPAIMQVVLSFFILGNILKSECAYKGKVEKDFLQPKEIAQVLIDFLEQISEYDKACLPWWWPYQREPRQPDSITRSIDRHIIEQKGAFDIAWWQDRFGVRPAVDRYLQSKVDNKAKRKNSRPV